MVKATVNKFPVCAITSDKTALIEIIGDMILKEIIFIECLIIEHLIHFSHSLNKKVKLLILFIPFIKFMGFVIVFEMKKPNSILFLVLIHCSFIIQSANDTFSFEKNVRPTLAKRCISCHNTNRPKANVNIDNYKEQGRVIKDGSFWLKVNEVIKNGKMPPKTEGPLSSVEFSTLTEGIDRILKSSLQQKIPGQVVIRRLSHSEYSNTIEDLLHIKFDAAHFFPSDGSGGAGFDNQGRALFVTPLKLERYYDAAEFIIDSLYHDLPAWNKIVPDKFNPTGLKAFINWIRSLLSHQPVPSNDPVIEARKVILPFATKAYRKILSDDDQKHLMNLFSSVYNQQPLTKNPERFEYSLVQVMKSVLVSPNFLFKVEEEPVLNKPYPLSQFEVANRLSYFLWNSMPDQELFELAYQNKLQDTFVLTYEVKRMLADPKSKRFAESFASQWLGIKKLLDPEPLIDTDKFPGFDEKIRKDLYTESIEYFYHVLTQSKNFLDLINSDYAILNKNLAMYYGIDGVKNEDFEKITLHDTRRGGVLGMGSVLSTTSTSLRTSPVLRGKWVLEQLLGTPPPPPPDVVAPLTDDKKTHEALGLRKILEQHRASPECRSCHEKMDPIGLGLENYDPTGRWRNTYEVVAVDPTGVMEDGTKFSGPSELKNILMSQKKKFARNLSVKMLSYALGRTIIFTDEPALNTLENNLLNNQFNPESFITEIVKSYVFLTKINDFEKKSI